MISNITQFWRIVRELNLDELERELRRPLAIRVSGSDAALLERAAGVLFPAREAAVQRVLLPEQAVAGVADLELLVLPAGRRATAQEVSAAHVLATRGAPVVLIVAAEQPLALADETPLADLPGFPAEQVAMVDLRDEAAARDRLVEAIVDAAPQVRLALARQHPVFREAVADRLVRETSGANAQFALFSSLPAYVPLLGGLVGDVADMMVLTKNQALLLFKLAGIYGRDPSARTRLLAEILPVVGGAFLWRSLARSLIGLLPTFVSAVPKTAVAFVGTYLVGEIARYYYDYGQRPPPATVQRFREEGLRLFRSAMGRLRR
ncbi:MAG: hypothetical protein HY690_07760 [Chloroflexi bacterium]|nr:hypothetical protein [Chloroflexota bacterium]